MNLILTNIKLSIFFVFLGLISYSGVSFSDVVKPALAEISFYNNNSVEIAIDFSIEAAMSDIGTQYKNTKDAPNSDLYDNLRGLSPNDLKHRFMEQSDIYTSKLNILVNGEKISLEIKELFTDIIGYKKRPRKSRIVYRAALTEWPETLSWSYHPNLGDSAIRWQNYEKDSYNWSAWIWLKDGVPSGTIDLDNPKPISGLDRFMKFTSIGFDHVIPMGLDHILFIIGMALSTLVFRNLLILVTSFTLAHTVTLGLAMYGVVSIPGAIVEPIIAFSIAYIALENIFGRENFKRQLLIVFFFGLVHGLGFAEMLKEFDMPDGALITTLIGFNVGVEIAQVLIVSCVLMLSYMLNKIHPNVFRWYVIGISSTISMIGIYWGIERLAI